MEFYKQARVIGITAGSILNLNNSSYNHKAVILVSEHPSASSDFVQLKFWYQGNKSSGVTFQAAAIPDSSITTNNFLNNIIPARLSEINASIATATIKAILLN